MAENGKSKLAGITTAPVRPEKKPAIIPPDTGPLEDAQTLEALRQGEPDVGLAAPGSSERVFEEAVQQVSAKYGSPERFARELSLQKKAQDEAAQRAPAPEVQPSPQAQGMAPAPDFDIQPGAIGPDMQPVAGAVPGRQPGPEARPAPQPSGQPAEITPPQVDFNVPQQMPDQGVAGQVDMRQERPPAIAPGDVAGGMDPMQPQQPPEQQPPGVAESVPQQQAFTQGTPVPREKPEDMQGDKILANVQGLVKRGKYGQAQRVTTQARRQMKISEEQRAQAFDWIRKASEGSSMPEIFGEQEREPRTDLGMTPEWSPEALRKDALEATREERAKFEEKAAEPVSGRTITDATLDAVRQIETGGLDREDMVSSAGALGPYQFMPATAREYGIDPWNEQEARQGARRFLQDSYRAFDGDMEKVIASYNAGRGGVQRAVRRAEEQGGNWKEYLPAETQEYLRRYAAAKEPDAAGEGPGGMVPEWSPSRRVQQLAEREQRLERPEKIRVRVPGRAILEFPYGVTQEQMGRKIREEFPDLQQGFVDSLVNSAVRGIGGGGEMALKGAAGLQTFIENLEREGIAERDKLRQGLDALRNAEDPMQKERMFNELRRRARNELSERERSDYLRDLVKARQGRSDFTGLRERGRMFTTEGERTPTEKRALFQAGEQLRESTEREFPVTPERADNYFNKVANAAGYTVPILAGAVINPAAGAAQAVTMGAGEATQRAVQEGASEEDIGLAAALGTAPGAVDYSPIDYLLRYVSRVHPAGRAAKRFLADASKRAVQQGFIEGTTEGVQEFMQNLIAQGVYNPNQELFENVPEGIKTGFGAGLLFGLPGGTYGAWQERKQRRIQEEIDRLRESGEEARRFAQSEAATFEEFQEEQAQEREAAGEEPAEPAEETVQQWQEARSEAAAGAAQDSGYPQEGARARVTFPDGETEPVIVQRYGLDEETGELQATLVDEGGGVVHQGPIGDLTINEVRGAGTAQEPREVESVEDIDEAVRERQQETPSADAGRAGNYRKTHTRILDLPVAIETPQGGTRTGTTPEGRTWSVDMPAHYGYIKRSEGADGDAVDVYIGDDIRENAPVYVIDQIDPDTGAFDEHKVVLGTGSQEQAEEIYRSAFDDERGGQRMGAVTEMTLPEFKGWLSDADLTQPTAYEPQAAPAEEAGPAEVEVPDVTPGRDIREAPPAGTADRTGQTPDVSGGVRYTVEEQDGSFIVRDTQTGNAVIQTGTRRQAMRRAAQENQRAAQQTEPEEGRAAREGTVPIDRAKIGPRVAQRPAEEPEQAEAGEEQAEASAADALLQALLDGQRFTRMQQVLRYIRQNTGQDLSNKDAEEALESAAVQLARGIADSQPASEAFDNLLNLMQSLPGFNTRTSESSARQAYSTPLPLALVASRLAGIDSDTWVYEPSAGNGALLIQADPNKTYVNEIDSDRAANLERLGFNTMREDSAGDLPIPERSVGAVVMNPPFGTDPTGGQAQYQLWDTTTGRIDHGMSATALEAMKDDGKAVLLVGGMREAQYRKPQAQRFYKQLYQRYNVTGHYQVAGELYSRQGAQWPVDVIVIDGRGQSQRPLPAAQAPQRLETWDSVKGLLDGVEAVEPAATERDGGVDAGERAGARVDTDIGTLGGEGRTRVREAADAADRRPAGERGEPAAERVEPAEPEGAGDTRGEPAERVAREDRRGSGQRAGQDRGRARGRDVSDQDRQERPATERRQGDDTRQVGDESAPAGQRDARAELADDEAFEAALAEAVGEETEPAAAEQQEAEPQDAPETASEGRGRQQGGQQARKPKDDVEAADDALEQAFRDAADDIPDSGEQYSTGHQFDEGIYQKVRDAITKSIDARIQQGTALADALKAVVDKLVERLNVARQTAAQYVRRWREDWKAGKVKLTGDTEAEAVKADSRGHFKEPADRRGQEEETEYQVQYRPRSQAWSIGTLVPRNMQSAITRATEKIEGAMEMTVDEYVANRLGYSSQDALLSSGHFAAEQIDALSMAIYNFERGSGYVVGDQTGIGKGRVVAGLLKYARRQGYTPVFFSKDPGLYADMIRDMHDVGETDIKPFVTNTDLRGKNAVPIEEQYGGGRIQSVPQTEYDKVLQKASESGDLPNGYNFVFTTYSQVQPGGNVERRRKFLQNIAGNAVFVLDESHLAGGTGGQQRQKKDATPTRAQWIRQLLMGQTGEAQEPKGVIYSSATYAKNPDVMDLYAWTDMSLSVPDPSQIGEAIKAGGVPLQQSVAQMLTDVGQYVRRERSFAGVPFRRQTIEADLETADKVSELMRRLYSLDRQIMQDTREKYGENEIETQGDTAQGDQSVGTPGIDKTNFAGLMHNIVGQALLALKTPAAVEQIRQAVENGQKPVIAVSATMESFMAHYAQENGIRVGDDMGAFNFNLVFQRYLEKTRWVGWRDPVSEEKQYHYLTDGEVQKYGGASALAAWKDLKRRIDETDLSELPPSPLDYLQGKLTEAGVKIREITGRRYTIDYDEGKKLATRDNGKGARKQAIIDFQNNEVDALLINESGATGLSMHAQPTQRIGEDQVKQRHMFVLQAHPNIDTFMQMLGRVHRTGQVKKPEFSLMLSNLPAETRPAAILAKKLASLNANTTADRDSAVTDEDSVDFMNEVGESVIRRLYADDTELQEMIGVDPTADEDIGPKITGRLVVMPIERQREFYDTLAREYKDEIERLDALDQNPLVAKTKDFQARSIAAQEIGDVKGDGDSLFSQPAVLEKLDVRRLRKPPTSDQVWDEITNNLDTDRRRAEAIGRRTASDIADEVAEAAKPAMEQIDEQIQTQEAEVRRLEQDSDATNEEKKDAETKLNRLRNRRKSMEDRLGKIRQYMDTFYPSVGVRFKQSGSDQETAGRITQIKYAQRAKDPTAFSNVRLSITLADSTPPFEMPISQLEAGGKGRYDIQPARYVDLDTGETVSIDEAFDNAQGKARETRYIVTGNVLAGYAYYGRDAQGIVSFTRSDGSLESGIMMPRGFDPAKWEAKQDVTIPDGSSMVKFLTAVSEGRVISTDDIIAFTTAKDRSGRPKIAVQVSTRGGKPFENNSDFREILRREGYREGLEGRKGKGYRQAVLDKSAAKEAFNLFSEQLGQQFITKSNKPQAREITGQDTGMDEIAQATAEDAPSDTEQYSVTRKFREDSGEIRDRIKKIARRINPNAKVQFVDQMFGKGKALRDSGATTEERMEVAGSYKRLSGLIRISLNLRKFDPYDTAYHELWHSLENLLTPEEHATLQQTFPDKDIGRQKERVARAFADWALKEDAAANSTVRRAFQKIRRFLQQVGNMLRGRGFKSYQDVFRKAYTGEMAQRMPRNTNNPTVKNVGDASMRADIHKALGELGYAPALIDDMDMREVNIRLWEQQAYSIGPRNRRKSRVQGSDVQEAVGRRLMASEETEAPWWQRIRDVLDVEKGYYQARFVQGMVDKFNAIKRLELAQNAGNLRDAAQSAYKLVQRTQNLQGTMMAVLKGGPLAWNGKEGRFMVRKTYEGFSGGFESIFEPLANDGTLHLWKTWAIAVRANRLNQEGRERLMANIAEDYGMSTQEAIDELLKLGGDPMNPNYQGEIQYPKFQQVFEHWQAFNRAMLDMMEATGLINQAQRNAWEKADYVPFYRVLEDQTVTPKRGRMGLEGQRPPIKELKGGEAQIDDVLENMVRNLTYMVDASYKNQAMRRVRKLAVDAGLMQKMPAAQVGTAMVSADMAKRALEKHGINVDEMSPSERRQIIQTFRLVPPQGEDVVSVMENGQVQYYRVLDSLLLQSITSMNDKQMGTILRLMSMPKRILTQGVTATPPFMIRNLMRDTIQTKVVTGADLKFGLNTAKGFTDALRMDDDLLEIFAGGGSAISGFYETGERAVGRHLHTAFESNDSSILNLKNLAKGSGRVLRGGWEKWQQVGFATENANRLAVYRSLRAKGYSTAEAIHEAQDLMNYSMRGDWEILTALINTVPFMNARIQGLYKIARAFSMDGDTQSKLQFLGRQWDAPAATDIKLPGGRSIRMNWGTWLRGSMLMGLSLAYWSLVHDDERYKDLPEWQIDMYYHFWIGDQHIRIPKPFEVGALFSTLPERGLNAVVDGEWGELYEGMGRMVFDTFAFNPVPQAVAPIAEQWGNRLFFFDRPILNREELLQEKTYPEAVFDQTTSETAKLLAQVMPDVAPNWSRNPKRIESLVRSYFGGLGTYVLATTDSIASMATEGTTPARKGPTDIFVARDFLPPDPTYTKWTDEFYELRDEVNSIHSVVQTAREYGNVERAKRIVEQNKGKMRLRSRLNRMSRALSDLREKEVRVRASKEMSAERKRELLDSLQRQRNDIVKNVQKMQEQIGE